MMQVDSKTDEVQGTSAAGAHFRIADVQGLTRLASDAVAGVTELVEAVQRGMGIPAGLPGAQVQELLFDISGLVCGNIRQVAALVADAVDAVFTRMTDQKQRPASAEREVVLAALNGVLGDVLEAGNNPLAIPMQLKLRGETPEVEGESRGEAATRTTGKLLVLAHGSCMSDGLWCRNGHDHGAGLSSALGYTPVYLQYNSGLHISINGRALAHELEELVGSWPVPVTDLSLLTHSMGGLVSRSALHYAAEAGYEWPGLTRHLVFLGTPHHGAPLERLGAWLAVIIGATPYAAPFARLGRIRSAGVTDLRYGNLLDEDWEGRDRFRPEGDNRHPLPLPSGVRCYAAAAVTGKAPGFIHDRVLGDGLVPLDSALGRHKDPGRALNIPEARQWIGYSRAHMDLLNDPELFEQLKQWLA